MREPRIWLVTLTREITVPVYADSDGRAVQLAHAADDFGHVDWIDAPCPTCDGSGEAADCSACDDLHLSCDTDVCPDCGGTGEIEIISTVDPT